MIVLSFKLLSDAFSEDAARVFSLTGEEELTRTFRYDVKLAFPRMTALPEVDAELLHAPAAIVFLQDGEEVRRQTGIVAEAQRYVSADAREEITGALTLTIVPRMWLLSEFRTTELFLDRSIPEILQQKLESIGLRADEDFAFSLSATYAKRELVVQYEEDGLSFVNRLCEHWGIAYFFEQRGGKDVVVFADHSGAFERFADDGGAVSFAGSGGDPLGVFTQSTTLRRIPRQVVVTDYNYRSPQLPLTAARPTSIEAGEGESFTYAPNAKTPAEATHLATIRADRLQGERRATRGTSRKMRFRPGRTFVLEDGSGQESDLLLTRVVHHARRAERDSEPTYDNAFDAISRETPYRPAQHTPRPKIAGLVHGVVDGAIKGPYAELDSEGRYRVHFRYDRSGRTNLTASHPVRLMQTHGGADYGLHFPLRPGTEVLIGFVEGDPDRPVIVGAAPNPWLRTPVSSRNHTENVLRSHARNELVMEDLDGQERVRLATPTANTVLQLGSIQEPELGALLRSDGSVTSVAGHALTDAAPLHNTLAVQDTTLAAKNLVHLAGLSALAPVLEQGGQEHARVDPHANALLGAVSSLSAFPVTATPPAEQNGPTKTWSALASNLADHANEEAEAAVRRMAFRTRRMSLASTARSKGQPPGSALGPHAIVGSSSGSTVFARDELLLFADRIASLSSDEVSRVVAGRQIEVQSPEEVEVAGRRAVRVTSASLVDVQGGQLYIRGGGTAEAENFPSDDISIAILADRTLRLKSANGALIACADDKVVLHSHEGSADLSAKGDVRIAGGSIHASAGPIAMKAANGVEIEAKEDIVAKTDGNFTVKPKQDFFVDAVVNIALHANGEITIRAPAITIDGDTTILGSLTVTDQIKSG